MCSTEIHCLECKNVSSVVVIQKKNNNNKLDNIELTKTERVKKLYPNHIRKFKKYFVL